MPREPGRNRANSFFKFSSFGQLGMIRGGGVEGIAEAYGKNCDAKAGAATAEVGRRRAAGVTRTKATVPTIGLDAALQACIEQSFCPGTPIAAQLLLSFWKLLIWRWCTGQ